MYETSVRDHIFARDHAQGCPCSRYPLGIRNQIDYLPLAELGSVIYPGLDHSTAYVRRARYQQHGISSHCISRHVEVQRLEAAHVGHAVAYSVYIQGIALALYRTDTAVQTYVTAHQSSIQVHDIIVAAPDWDSPPMIFPVTVPP